MEPMCTVRISERDALDGLTDLVITILSHMGAVSDTFIGTLRAHVESASGLSDASKDFEKQILLAAEVSVKAFKGQADA